MEVTTLYMLGKFQPQPSGTTSYVIKFPLWCAGLGPSLVTGDQMSGNSFPPVTLQPCVCASQSMSSKHREEVASPLPEINGEKPIWQVS